MRQSILATLGANILSICENTDEMMSQIFDTLSAIENTDANIGKDNVRVLISEIGRYVLQAKMGLSNVA